MPLSGYSFFREIDVDHTQCGSSDSPNFAVRFSGTYSWLKTVGNGGHVQNSNGDDIVFSSDQSTILNFNLRSYDPVTGKILAFVELASVSHSTDTKFYIYYGNSSISTYQGSDAATYNSNYVSVWPCDENAANTTAHDIKSGFNLTMQQNTSALTTAGKIGPAFSFNGSSDYGQASYIAAHNPAHFTLMALVQVQGGNGNYRAIVSNRDAANHLGYILYDNDANTLAGWVGNGGWNILGDGGISLNTWYLIHFTSDGSTSTLYINGSSVASGAEGYTVQTSYGLRIGAGANEGSADFFFNGIEQEIRLLNVAVGADWITTESNNLLSATFYSVGSEQSTGGTATKSLPMRTLVRTRVTKSLPVRVLVRTQQTKSLPVRVLVRTQKTISLPVRTLVRTGITKSLPVRNVVRTLHTLSLPARTVVRTLTTKSLPIRTKAATQVTKSLQIRSVVRGRTLSLQIRTVVASQAPVAVYMAGYGRDGYAIGEGA